MTKITILAVALGMLLLANYTTAAPMAGVDTFVEGMKTMLLGAAEFVSDLSKGGNVGQKIKEKFGEVVGRFAGGGRGGREKRSISASLAVTKFNKTDFQHVEIKKSWDGKDHQKQQEEITCLVKDNEIYWLDFMAGAMIQILQEMKKVLDGKRIAWNMTKNAYEQARVKP